MVCTLSQAGRRLKKSQGDGTAGRAKRNKARRKVVKNNRNIKRAASKNAESSAASDNRGVNTVSGDKRVRRSYATGTATRTKQLKNVIRAATTRAEVIAKKNAMHRFKVGTSKTLAEKRKHIFKKFDDDNRRWQEWQAKDPGFIERNPHLWD